MVYSGERPMLGSEQASMTGCEALRVLGSPEVRNAILLNEIGVIIHELGKLSEEFVSAASAFPHHLILRRLTRGRDPFLGSERGPLSALRCALRNCPRTDQERAVASVVGDKIDRLTGDDRASVDAVSRRLEVVLGNLPAGGGPDHLEAVERVESLARGVLADWAWQIQGERSLEAMESPFISAEGFQEGLDQLPFVADLVEMQGRTWHPEGLLPPEVRLFRAIHEGEEVRGAARSWGKVERLAAVRELCCEVLANQLLEINNIKKDGPGDLGSWFWMSRLCARSDEAMALLRGFDQGAELEGEERAAVRWLGVRDIARWACGKVLVETTRGGSRRSLWEHCWALSGLYKSSTAQALVEGIWPQRHRLSWCTLAVVLERPDPEALNLVKGLVEVECPLGNELRRGYADIHFTFPELESELATSLLDGLRAEVGRLVGRDVHARVALGPRIAPRGCDTGQGWA